MMNADIEIAGRYGPRPRRSKPGRQPAGRPGPDPGLLDRELIAAIARYEAIRLRPPRDVENAHDDLAAWLVAYSYARPAGWYDHAGIRYIPTDDGSFLRERIPPRRSPVRSPA